MSGLLLILHLVLVVISCLVAYGMHVRRNALCLMWMLIAAIYMVLAGLDIHSLLG